MARSVAQSVRPTAGKRAPRASQVLESRSCPNPSPPRKLRLVIPPARLAEISQDLRPYATAADGDAVSATTSQPVEYLAVEALLELGWGTGAWPLTMGLPWLGYSVEDAHSAVAGLLRARLLDYAEGRAVLSTLGDWARRGPEAQWLAALVEGLPKNRRPEP